MSIRVEYRANPFIQGGSYLVGSYQQVRKQRETEENRFKAEQEIANRQAREGLIKTVALAGVGAGVGGILGGAGMLGGLTAGTGALVGGGLGLAGGSLGSVAGLVGKGGGGGVPAGLVGAVDPRQEAAGREAFFSSGGTNEQLFDYARQNAVSPDNAGQHYFQAQQAQQNRLDYAGDLNFEREAGTQNARALARAGQTGGGQTPTSPYGGGGGGGPLPLVGQGDPGPLSLDQGGPQARLSPQAPQQPRGSYTADDNQRLKKLQSQLQAVQSSPTMRQGEKLRVSAKLRQQMQANRANPSGPPQPTFQQRFQQNSFVDDERGYTAYLDSDGKIKTIKFDRRQPSSSYSPDRQPGMVYTEKGHDFLMTSDGPKELREPKGGEAGDGISAKDRFKAIYDLTTKGGKMGKGIPFEEAEERVDKIIASVRNPPRTEKERFLELFETDYNPFTGGVNTPAETRDQRLADLPAFDGKEAPRGNVPGGIPFATKGGVGQVPGQTYIIILKDGSKRIGEFNGRGYINVRPIPNQGGALSLAESN